MPTYNYYDDIMNFKTNPERLSIQASNTNLNNIGSMVSLKQLSQNIFGKLKQVKLTVENINTNNKTNGTNEINYCGFTLEARKHRKYFSNTNVSCKRSLEVSMKNSFLERSFTFPQYPNTDLILHQNVDPMETTSAHTNSNDHLEQNNDDMTRQSKNTTYQHPSNEFRQQKVKDWLNLHTDRLQYDPLEISTTESIINTPLGDSYDRINDFPSNASVFLNLSSMTESTSSLGITDNLTDDSSQDIQNNFNNSRKTEVLVKKDSSKNTKNSKPTISKYA